MGSHGGNNTLVDTDSSGATTFVPEFTKQEAKYTDARSNSDNITCKDCAHYIEGGGCHVVQGEIDPDGKCDNFYSDIGMFVRGGGTPDVNLVLWGEKFRDRFGDNNVRGAISEMRNKIEDRLGM